MAAKSATMEGSGRESPKRGPVYKRNGLFCGESIIEPPT